MVKMTTGSIGQLLEGYLILVTCGISYLPISTWKPISAREDVGMVLASRALGVCFFDTQTLKKHPPEYPKDFVRNLLKCQSQAYN